MARIKKENPTRILIIKTATEMFFEHGFSKTTVAALSKKAEISTGNFTFHFPTKEHMLAELVDMLCKYQQKRMEEEARDGTSSIMAICLELLTITSACEQDEVAKDFFLSSYQSEMCMEHIRKNDTERAKEVFKEYCPGWADEQFEEAETLVSGIEYATLMTTSNSASLELRISGALNAILRIYNVPEDVRKQKIAKVISMDYRALGLQVLERFRTYVDSETEKALYSLLARKQTAE